MELVITSDDPITPVKSVDLMAYTVWSDYGCRKRCEDCKDGPCEKHQNEYCCDVQQGYPCCDDDEDEEEG